LTHQFAAARTRGRQTITTRRDHGTTATTASAATSCTAAFYLWNRRTAYATHFFGSKVTLAHTLIEVTHFSVGGSAFSISRATLVEALHVLAATLGSSHRLLDSTAFLEFDFTFHVVSSLRERCWS
jgi:hypothetical protein